MQKLLMGVAASAVLASMAQTAQAAPMAVTVGGYFNTALMAQDFDAAPDATSLNQEQDGEFHVKGKRKLDNGMELGFQIQVEAEQSSDQIDEHYIYLKGDFGRLTIGAENSAANMLTVGYNKYLGYKQAADDFLVDLKKTGYLKTEHAFVTGDANKITYVSPRIAGLQAGISLTPSTKNLKGDARGVEESGDGVGDNAISLGLRYKGAFNGVKVAASYASEKAEEGGSGADGDGTFEDSSIGLEAKTKGFTFSYLSLTRESENWGSTADYEKDFSNIAISYKLNKKTTIGFDMQDDEVTAGNGAGDTYEHVRFGGNYKLASGMSLTLSQLDAEKTSGGATQNSSVTTVGLLLKF